MKKTIAISLVLAFILTGCSINFKKDKDTTEQKTSGQTENATPEDTSLLGQLQSGSDVECTVTTLNGEVNVKAKGGKIKIEGIPYVYDQSASTDTALNPNKGTMLTIGDEQYMWLGDKGTKFNAKELSELSGGQTEQQMEAKSWQENIGDWQQAGFGYKCEKRNLSDELFAVPSEVTFTDLNEALKKLQDLISSTTIPTGSMPTVDIAVPAGMPEVENQ